MKVAPTAHMKVSMAAAAAAAAVPDTHRPRTITTASAPHAQLSATVSMEGSDPCATASDALDAMVAAARHEALSEAQGREWRRGRTSNGLVVAVASAGRLHAVDRVDRAAAAARSDPALDKVRRVCGLDVGDDGLREREGVAAAHALAYLIATDVV